MRVFLIFVVTLSVLAGPLQRMLADQQSTAKDASIIVAPSRSDARKIGNVKVTFTDGHSEVANSHRRLFQRESVTERECRLDSRC